MRRPASWASSRSLHRHRRSVKLPNRRPWRSCTCIWPSILNACDTVRTQFRHCRRPFPDDSRAGRDTWAHSLQRALPCSSGNKPRSWEMLAGWWASALRYVAALEAALFGGVQSESRQVARTLTPKCQSVVLSLPARQQHTLGHIEAGRRLVLLEPCAFRDRPFLLSKWRRICHTGQCPFACNSRAPLRPSRRGRPLPLRRNASVHLCECILGPVRQHQCHAAERMIRSRPAYRHRRREGFRTTSGPAPMPER